MSTPPTSSRPDAASLWEMSRRADAFADQAFEAACADGITPLLAACSLFNRGLLHAAGQIGAEPVAAGIITLLNEWRQPDRAQVH